MMKLIDTFWGLLIQRQEAVEYLKNDKPIKSATLIVFLSSLLLSVSLLSLRSDTLFNFLAIANFFRIIFVYWILGSLLLNFLFNRFCSGRGSLDQTLSFLGFLSPIFSLILLLGLLVVHLPTTPPISIALLQIILTIYFVIISSNGLAIIYQQPKMRVILLMIASMLADTPLFAIMKYLK